MQAGCAAQYATRTDRATARGCGICGGDGSAQDQVHMRCTFDGERVGCRNHSANDMMRAWYAGES